MFNFKDITKDITKQYLQGEINTLIINEKIINKKTPGIWTLTQVLTTQKR